MSFVPIFAGAQVRVAGERVIYTVKEFVLLDPTHNHLLARLEVDGRDAGLVGAHRLERA